MMRDMGEKIGPEQMPWLKQVLGSERFQRARGERELLQRLAELTIAGKTANAREVAQEIYPQKKKSATAISALSVTATRLRKRLEDYGSEAKDDPWRIVIPRGQFDVFLEPRTPGGGADPAKAEDPSLKLLVRLLDRGRIPFDDRLEIAQHLGKFGDPRIAEAGAWVEVKSGTRPLWFGKYPVTVGEYERFVKKVNGPEPDAWGRQLERRNCPVTGVSWEEARDYCRWRKGRLPTVEEWESAARGGRDVKYPWGNEDPDARRANYSYEGSPKRLLPVGLFPEGRTNDGLQDMAGNVREWTASDSKHEKGQKSVRGGSWNSPLSGLEISRTDGLLPSKRNDYVGFRCVREDAPQ